MQPMLTQHEKSVGNMPMPIDEGIPERPKEQRCDEGQHVYCSAAATKRYVARVEALLSAKDAELAESDRKGRELCCAYGNALIRIGDLERDSLMKVRELGLTITPHGWINERAEAAEAELTFLRASSARIEEETLRKAARVFDKRIKEICNDHGSHDYSTNSTELPESIEEVVQDLESARDMILALLPTSPEKEQTGEEG